MSFGPITWIYIADILPDVGLGICVANLWLFTLVVGLGISEMEWVFSPDGGYFLVLFIGFIIFNILGLLFIIFVIVETKGKS